MPLRQIMQRGSLASSLTQSRRPRRPRGGRARAASQPAGARIGIAVLTSSASRRSRARSPPMRAGPPSLDEAAAMPSIFAGVPLATPRSWPTPCRSRAAGPEIAFEAAAPGAPRRRRGRGSEMDARAPRRALAQACHARDHPRGPAPPRSPRRRVRAPMLQASARALAERASALRLHGAAEWRAFTRLRAMGFYMKHARPGRVPDAVTLAPAARGIRHPERVTGRWVPRRVRIPARRARRSSSPRRAGPSVMGVLNPRARVHHPGPAPPTRLPLLQPNAFSDPRQRVRNFAGDPLLARFDRGIT